MGLQNDGLSLNLFLFLINFFFSLWTCSDPPQPGDLEIEVRKNFGWNRKWENVRFYFILKQVLKQRHYLLFLEFFALFQNLPYVYSMYWPINNNGHTLQIHTCMDTTTPLWPIPITIMPVMDMVMVTINITCNMELNWMLSVSSLNQWKMKNRIW